MKVIIADDDATIRLLLKRSVSKLGHEVVVATDGIEALSLIAREKEYVLALLDWEMPGMNGIDVCKALQGPEITVPCYTILITGRSTTEDIVDGLASGANDFVSKPINQPVLRAKLEVAIRSLRLQMEVLGANEELRKNAQIMKQQNDQIVHADRMAHVGTMAAGMAHEINNPNSFISGNAQTQNKFWGLVENIIQKAAEEEGPDQGKLQFVLEEMPKTIDGIMNGVRRISTIVKSLKAFSRKDSGSQDPVDLNECVKDAQVLCNSSLKSRAQLNLKLGTDLPTITGCAQEIEQVIINLITNGADALEDAGIEDPVLTVETARVRDSVILSVEDNGDGVPEDLIEKIFQPFFTTKDVDRGTGLGLAICKGIVERHGGEIELRNKANGGAVFRLCFALNTELESKRALTHSG